MDLSTSNHPDNKRICFLEPEELKQDVTPMELALSVVKMGLALLPNIYNDSLIKLSNDYICSQTKAIHKKDQINKLNQDPDYIPKSAWVEFSLCGKKSLQETPEFEEVAKKIEATKTTFHQMLKITF